MKETKSETGEKTKVKGWVRNWATEKRKENNKERTQLGIREVDVEAVRWMREALRSRCLPAE